MGMWSSIPYSSLGRVRATKFIFIHSGSEHSYIETSRREFWICHIFSRTIDSFLIFPQIVNLVDFQEEYPLMDIRSQGKFPALGTTEITLLTPLFVSGYGIKDQSY